MRDAAHIVLTMWQESSQHLSIDEVVHIIFDAIVFHKLSAEFAHKVMIRFFFLLDKVVHISQLYILT